MISAEFMAKLGEGTLATLYMTIFTTIFGYVVGLPCGIVLSLTGKGGLKENKVIYRIFDVIVNLIRSVPFLILIIVLMPYTKKIVGQSYGTKATFVPLVVCAAPFIARIVENSLREVDDGVVEAARAMGADTFTIVTKVLLVEAKTSLLDGATLAIGTILGYSAMAGIVGGGGLGDIATRYGYYRFDSGKMWITVVLLVILVNILQTIGINVSKKTDKRRV